MSSIEGKQIICPECYQQIVIDRSDMLSESVLCTACGNEQDISLVAFELGCKLARARNYFNRE